MGDGRAADIQATLQAWRERGADRADPLRFHLIAAMAARAARHDGDARRVLDDRLAELVGQYEARLADTGLAGSVDAQAPTHPPAPGTLAALLEHIAAPVAADAASDRRGRYPELDLLDYFQATWARLSTDRQLRQSQEQVHENAGPLNSNHLVHRALSLMREQSPGYLHQFLSYLDALSWVEQLNNNGGLAAKPAARARKGARTAR
ncbi:DUF2894 domain-containing protein [Bordetella sp. BOR01]|uniref:DUF2894 domain-containing protein n=1 Tax=Bordetella sp. BOR01 TaxID=2854779 RepID=UPI001C470E4C|nr:DUF2894 domain-containing protein [Bordetella sp. BOR01]MBV7483933.1 DUF2894 domain-containing protein [Bordetella sp. BOR01]